MELFETRGERDAGHVRVCAAGELDLATMPRLAACVREYAIGDRESVEIDLRRVAFIDSTGIRLLMELRAQALEEGWTLTVVPSEAVRRIIVLLGLQRHLLEVEAAAAPQVDVAPAGPPSALVA